MALTPPSPVSGQSQPFLFVPVAAEVLSGSPSRCFFRDVDGYFWIGTEDALIRYDGTHAYRYVNDQIDKITKPYNTISTIIEHLVWVGAVQVIFGHSGCLTASLSNRIDNPNPA